VKRAIRHHRPLEPVYHPDMTRSTTLATRRLGTSDLTITTVGFGAWAIGGGGWAFGWGPQDDEQSIATIRHALARGINWIDTAAVYGLGHSEEVVRRALEGMPAADRPYVFTKCGMVWDDADRMASPRQTLRPESIRRECEASLRRLGVERIDLYQFHWPDQSGTAIEDSWAAMIRLVEEGKVRAAGVCGTDPTRDMRRFLIALRDAGSAVVLVSAELEEVTALADRLLVIRGGKIVGEVDPKVSSAEEIGLMMTGGD